MLLYYAYFFHDIKTNNRFYNKNIYKLVHYYFKVVFEKERVLSELALHT